MPRTGISILGATGSIGKSTLDVVTRHSDRFEIIALTAHSNVARMTELCVQHQPQYVVMSDADAAKALVKNLSGLTTEVLSGPRALEEVAVLDNVDFVMAAIVGAAGLLPSLAAARAGKRVLLANKEALVMSGELFMQAVKDNKSQLLPIDSEHNAIFQCMPAEGMASKGVERILLTASGGPFRTMPTDQLRNVTPAQAIAHPNWEMGRKISVDSATMMNKGLEVIEAHWLFGASADDIQVVIHPQSIIHSMVTYTDGSVLAQLGNPDMRTPIAHALAWPDRMDAGVEPLDLFKIAHLDFEPADMTRFPCLALAYQALRVGGTAPCLLNAANEVAVDAFLHGHLPFTEIAKLIETVLEQRDVTSADSLETVLEADAAARSAARHYLKEYNQ